MSETAQTALRQTDFIHRLMPRIELILLLWTNLLPVSFVVLPYNLIIYNDLIIFSTFTFSFSFFLNHCHTFKLPNKQEQVWQMVIWQKWVVILKRTNPRGSSAKAHLPSSPLISFDVFRRYVESMFLEVIFVPIILGVQ